MSATRLVVEVADLVDAARSIANGVADPLTDQISGAIDELRSCGGMAGDDPGGTAWANAYDHAAPLALTAAQDVVNGCYRLATMFGATARNYARAEASSTTGARHEIGDELASLPDDMSVSFPTDVPTAGDGEIHLPVGWHLIAGQLSGFVWPNGHQDRLRRAAAAWKRSANALDGHSDAAALADILPLVDGLPEGPDIATVCQAMCSHLRSLAHAHRSLARACETLAQHLDVAHSAVEHELVSLVEWTAGIQVVGGFLAAFTGGAAEVPTQGEEAARIAITAGKIVGILRTAAEAIKAAATSIPIVADTVATISRSLTWLRDLRIVAVEVTGVPGLRVLQIERIGRDGKAITTTEMGAEDAALGRLADEGGDLIPYSGRTGLGGNFQPPKVFRDRHGRLTNGEYTTSDERMAPHVSGSLSAGKSQFFASVDSDKAALDASAYADENGLWVRNRAKVYVQNGPVGVWAKTGRPTHWINVYRAKSGTIHATPGGPP